MTHTNDRTFVVVCRARAATFFGPDEEWTVTDFPAGSGRVNVAFRTAYIDHGFEAKVPRWLFAEVSGSANSMNDALSRFSNASRALTPLFDVALNSCVEDLDIHLGYDTTPGIEEREFFQNFLRDEPPSLRKTRPARATLLSALTQAISAQPDHERIHRAAAHYQQTLRYWAFGDEVRAVGHLWMGIEALTPVAKRHEMSRTGTGTPADLARALGVELKALDPTLRERVLFSGDAACYKETLEVSNGLEHGYMAFDALRAIARGVRDAAAQHLRKAILVLSAVPDPVRNEMLLEPFESPIIGFPLARYVRGTLRGQGNPAPEGQRYPTMTWRTEVTKFQSARDDGRRDVQFQDQLSPHLAPGFVFSGPSIEIWSGDRVETQAEVVEATVTRKGSTEQVSPDSK